MALLTGSSGFLLRTRGMLNVEPDSRIGHHVGLKRDTYPCLRISRKKLRVRWL